MISYADFITLLFALFVVMYAISSVNEGKYRVLSDSLTQAFRNASNAQGVSSGVTPIPSGPAVPASVAKQARGNAEAESRREQHSRKMRSMAEDIKRALEPLVRGGQVSVTEGTNGISIEINASALFSPGEAQLGVEASRPLQAVAELVAQGDFPVKVEGHTDTIPISTPAFPSNWELSAVRASSVVRLFVNSGVAPIRLTAAGYGDQHPVAENATAQGRARNRRVTILIESTMPDLASASVEPGNQTDAALSTMPGAVTAMPLVKGFEGALGTPENIRLVPRSASSGAN
jgi:chemotaxis protein MotB